ncbi:hypothetical protein A7A76_08110 [Lysobacter enzymogenes]|uniref:hypothetical protein n=1 Tax=Lysobacter enzymogenes TaxID=69 RepID=UPI0019D2CDFA|nr:hypothetical protein [Lysobacter enzymogenes]MBN7139046.1 hypothetical protein [Lysobacter enzymogenes]
MKTRSLLGGAIVVAAIGLGLSACSNAVKDPKYERNPNPRQKYVVTAKVDGAPGPFRVATASVQYKIGPTQQCMPPAEPISGTFPTPDREVVSLPVRKMAESEFQFDVYLDGMVAKDYFGRGVCTWEIEGVTLSLKPTGAKGERRFATTIDMPDATELKPVIMYARREKYGTPVSDVYDEVERSMEVPHATALYGSDPSKFFAITFSAKESGHDR